MPTRTAVSSSACSLSSTLPRATAERDGGFEQRELVGPGREAAQAAVLVQTAEHRDERVVRRLERDVLEFLAVKRRKALSAAPHLVAGGAQEERMQPFNGLVVGAPAGSEVGEPPARFGVERRSLGLTGGSRLLHRADASSADLAGPSVAPSFGRERRHRTLGVAGSRLLTSTDRTDRRSPPNPVRPGRVRRDPAGDAAARHGRQRAAPAFWS